jgi:hypothetical protein
MLVPLPLISPVVADAPNRKFATTGDINGRGITIV